MLLVNTVYMYIYFRENRPLDYFKLDNYMHQFKGSCSRYINMQLPFLFDAIMAENEWVIVGGEGDLTKSEEKDGRRNK